ncbi:uncharacterized protein SCHCODRAFT_02636897 [Schizophyllum commune H4-8]|nr:uncharacterized protein SCHCODRAFT_02636897 [Schizophyllum commune H4-8]KAI5888505.1 hypothetical protein SCHCODRAFT_02636897 [Schizophyllum commune H4-8]
MPSADRLESSGSQHEERDREGRGYDKGRKSAKSKDLSHVPCKFFRVGGCTAGSSCPFSHSSAEPGAPKDTCAWFVKGNCKFGHKCALAHVLPGQSMAMDRKNKRAAQQAAGGGGGKEGGGRRGKREGAGASGRSNSLLSGGSTAPTRSGRPPMSLKVSPSAPAPAIKNTDFASFTEALDESAELPAAPARQQSQSSPTHEAADPINKEAPSPASSIPVASPRRQAKTTPPPADLGPIGSPPRQSGLATSPRRINGLTPSPSRDASSSLQANEGATTSPFSAPHNQTAFREDAWQNKGIAASLGSGLAMTMGGGNGAVSRSVGWSNMDDEGAYNQRTIRGRPPGIPDDGGEDDLEEFIPGSLTDLLTPEERSRRMSRTNSGQTPTGTPSQHQPLPPREPAASGHRYSRSVPAPSLLADVRSIWSENPPADAPKPPLLSSHSGLPSSPNAHLGVPGSFSHGSFVDDNAFIIGLSPSNASAAFLPSIHQNYAKQQLGRGVRNVSAPIYGQPNAGNPARSPFDLTQYSQGATNAQTESYLRNGPQPRNITAPQPGVQENLVMSPSTRALQSHAPGQSLPQGLAAGYSRIHALPPPLPLASPSGSTFGAVSTSPGVGGANAFGSFSGSMSDWAASTPPPGISGAGVGSRPAGVPGSQQGGSTLDQMFSRLSYSAAAKSKAPAPATAQKGPAQGVSPLSQPAAAPADDDDLFSMDNMDA